MRPKLKDAVFRPPSSANHAGHPVASEPAPGPPLAGGAGRPSAPPGGEGVQSQDTGPRADERARATSSVVPGSAKVAARQAARPPWPAESGAPAPAHLYRAVTGRISDVSAQVVTIADAVGERRFVLTSDATAWSGETLEPSALTRGDEAVIRLLPSQSTVADRIWANIGRVCGVIVDRKDNRLLVTEGTTRRQQTVVIPPEVSTRIMVRCPNLRPGYLIDIIGTRRDGVLYGMVPATPQPPYRSDLMQPQRPVGGRLPQTITGSAVWHDSADEPYGVLGVFYPCIDPGAGCAEDAAAGIAPGHARAWRELPYLAIGSALLARNECTGISYTLPVTGCAPNARLFNDHCVTCRPSPRGRVADLTLASFVALGGELDKGCFHATLTIGR